MNGDINRSVDLELTVTDSLNNGKLNGNSYSIVSNNKSNFDSFNCNNNCDSHQLNSPNGVTENGNGYVPITPRKQHSYNLNKAQKSKRCSTCATKLCIFCTGFIIGLLLSLILLSAFQFFSENSTTKRYNESRNNESLKGAEIVKVRGDKNSDNSLMRSKLSPIGRKMKNFTEKAYNSENNGYPSENDINSNFVNKTTLSLINKMVTTAEPEINYSYPMQGQDQGFNDVDNKTSYIETLFADQNYKFNNNLSGIDFQGITIEPLLTTGRIIEIQDNSSQVNNYKNINKSFTADINEAINDLTTTSTASYPDLNSGNHLIDKSDENIGLNNYNNSLMTENITTTDNIITFETNLELTTKTSIDNNLSETTQRSVEIIGTDLVHESEAPTETYNLTPTETYNLTPTEQSIDLLTEWKPMPNQTDAVFSSTTSENIINLSTGYNITTNTSELPTTTDTSFSTAKELYKTDSTTDPFIIQDITTDRVSFENNTFITDGIIADDINTTEPVFVGLTTPSLMSAEVVTEGSTTLSPTTISFASTDSQLSLLTTISDKINDTLFLNGSDAIPDYPISPDLESNDTFLLLNPNKTSNYSIFENPDFNSNETNDYNNNTLELSSNTTLNFDIDFNSTTETNFLNNTNLTIISENMTESIPTANISWSKPPEVYCLSTQFSCPNETNRCLDNDLICDGVIHCSLDGFDEQNCYATNCSANFMCANSAQLNSTDVICISRQSYCDRIWDCEDGSDELGCHLNQCQNGEFLCRDNSSCIKGKQACDFVYHCPDHSDEIGCVSRTSCESMGRFYCDDGLCIERSLRCDGIPDCHNGTDEHNCVSPANCSSMGQFFCDNGNCIERSNRCNGINDCNDWSDEFECVRNDEKGVVQVYEPIANTWSILCAKTNFNTSDADRICHRFGYLKAENYSLLDVIPVNSWADGILDNPIHSTVCETNQTVSVFCDNFKCGLNQRGQDIAKGSELKSSEDVPPSLLIEDKDGHQCPAQIIASKWLITSAQCVKNLSIEFSKVKLVDNSQNVNINKILIHSQYSRFRSLRFSDFDIALVETKQSLHIKEGNTVCLPKHQIDPEITCFVGTDFGDIPYDVIEKQVCNSSKHFNTSLTARHFCANTNTQSISSVSNKRCVPNGSPLICLSSSSYWYIAGFAAYQHGCNGSHFIGHLSHPTVFSNIYSMKNFIEKAIGINQYLIQTDQPLYNENYGYNFETTIAPNVSDLISNSSIYENFNETIDSNFTQLFDQIENLNITDNLNKSENASEVLTNDFDSVLDLNTTNELLNENKTTIENSNTSDSLNTKIKSNRLLEEVIAPDLSINDSLITTSEIPTTTQIPIITKNPIITESPKTTTENLIITESPKTTTENLIITESPKTTTENLIITESPKTTTENLIITESPKTTTENLIITESPKTTTENLIITESPKTTTENLIITESPKTTTPPIISTESLNKITKGLKSFVEYEVENNESETTTVAFDETDFSTDSFINSNDTILLSNNSTID